MATQTSIEADVHLHNTLIDTTAKAIHERIADKYDLSDSFKAIQAVAKMITAKANKQTEVLLTTTGE